MAESIFRPATVLHWWRAAGFDRKTAWRNDPVTERAEPATDQLITILDEAAETGRRVSEEVVNAVAASQPTANAASICRWKLLTLRQRMLDMGGARRFGENGEAALRHIEEAATAAQRLSYGYRLHNLDR